MTFRPIIFWVAGVSLFAGIIFWALQPEDYQVAAEEFQRHLTVITVGERIDRSVTISGSKPLTPGDRTGSFKVDSVAGILLETRSYFLGLSMPPREGSDAYRVSDSESVGLSVLRGKPVGSIKGALISSYEEGTAPVWLADKDLHPVDGVLYYRDKPFVLLQEGGG